MGGLVDGGLSAGRAPRIRASTGTLPPSAPAQPSVETVLTEGDEYELNMLAFRAQNAPGAEAAPILYSMAYLASQCLEGRTKTYECALKHRFRAPTPESLQAYRHLVLNIVSVDAAFVRFALRMVVGSLLECDAPEVRALGVRCALDVLDLYGAAHDVLASALRAHFPHMLRPVDDLVRYVGATLHLARETKCPRLRVDIVTLVVEQLVDLQCQVDDEVMVLPTSPIGSPSDDFVDADGGSPAKPTKVLCDTADKMDKLLMVVFDYLDRSHKESPAHFASAVLEPVVQAFVRLVVPARCGRFLPALLIRVLALGGRTPAERTCEHFLAQFFDERLHGEARLSYLALSAAVVGRMRTASPAFALGWMRRVAAWANHYVDGALEANEVFLGAIRVLLTLVLARKDAFDPAVARGPDALPCLRLLRVLDSELAPGVAVPPKICQAFARMVGVDEDAARRWALKAHGRRRNLAYVDLMQPMQLPLAEQAMSHLCRPSPYLDLS